MFYSLLKFVTKIALLAYYRKIHIRVTENLLVDRPLILASNHPNAFTEPLLMTCFFKRRFYFITRADVFVKRFKWFFDWTHQIPIYRFRDGYHTLKSNKDTFEVCHNVLDKNGAILIFSEGTTQLGKSVRPLQKGTAKLALSYLEKYPNSDISIVPVGFTYTKPINWNGDVFLNTGPIHKIKDMIGDEKDIHTNIKEINKLVFREIQKLAIHIEDKADEELVEGITNLYRKSGDASLSISTKNKGYFAVEQNLLNKIISRKNILITHWNTYNKFLQLKNLNKEYNPINGLPLIKWLLFIVFTPLALVGLLIGAGPFLYTKSYISNMENVIMRSGTWIGLNMGLCYIIIIAATIAGTILFGWEGLLLLPGTTFFLFVGVRWLSFAHQAINRIKYVLIPNKAKEEIIQYQSKITQEMA